MTTSTNESSASDWSNLNSPASSSSSVSAELKQRIFFHFVPENSPNQNVSMPGPYIEILEQPQTHMRFRYDSEGDHGYLYGEKATNMLPTYPTVKLENYKGKVHIRCELYQYDKEEKHPHQLKFHRQENQIDYLVPVNGSYIVYFEKLSFFINSSNSFSKELRAQYKKANPGARLRDVNKYCKKVVKSIDFNKVRLRFSAHDIQTGVEICHVYSRPILNANNPETNKLKIVRVTKTSCQARGSEETTLLVEKISNKNTKVRFVEAEGEWSAIAHPIYKHHQFAIVCRIPPYKNKDLAHNVDVFIELFRETDGATSNRIPFQYIGRPHLAKRAPKREFTEGASQAVAVGEYSDKNMVEPPIKIKKSIGSPQVCEVPVSQQCWSTDFQMPYDLEQLLSQELSKTVQNDQKADLASYLHQDNFNLEDSEYDAFLQRPSTALLFEETSAPNYLVDEEDSPSPILHNRNPVLSEASPMISIMKCSLITQHNEMKLFDKEYYETETPPFQDLISDSAQRREYKDSEIDKLSYQSMSPKLKIKESPEVSKRHHTLANLLAMEKMKELVRDIIILLKQNGPKTELQTKLVNLFELDLPKGETVLHVAINQPILSVLVNTLHVLDMTYLLNQTNDLDQTVLHLAVLNEFAETVRMLVSKGCDPMLVDVDGNNAVHLAVTSFPTLTALLDAMAVNQVPYNVNGTNYDNQTALHVAAINGCEQSLCLLLKNDADIMARDRFGRTALHLAACHDRAGAVSILLDNMDAGDVDTTDCRGHTALQTACDSDVRENTLAIIQLLLEAKANPTKSEGNTVSAMNLARRHWEIRQMIVRYQHKSRLDDSEDEYYTASEEENEDCRLAFELQGLIINEVKIP